MDNVKTRNRIGLANVLIGAMLVVASFSIFAGPAVQPADAHNCNAEVPGLCGPCWSDDDHWHKWNGFTTCCSGKYENNSECGTNTYYDLIV